MRGSTLTLLTVALAASGCTVFLSLDDHGEGAFAGDAGGIDAGEDASLVLPSGCDEKLDPKDAPCQVSDDLGVFVSPTGNDSGSGTKASPLLTITAGINKVLARQQETNRLLVGVYVCEGPYNEALVLADSTVNIYGGFTCAGWSAGTLPSSVTPPTKGYALRVERVGRSDRPNEIQDLVFTARSGELPGESSVAAFVIDSTLELKRVELFTGTGIAGENGAPITGPGNAATANPAGFGATSVSTPGGANQCTCAIDKTTSNGGAGSLNANGGGGGTAQTPPDPPNDTGVGAGASCATPAKIGSRGQPRTQQTAAGLGVVTLAGWEPSRGAAGLSGGTAQGGGGGAGGIGGAGGGGGCGGCGGAGGNGGGGGGGSIGVVAFNAALSFTSCRIKLGNAGGGGTGGLGQNGFVGGAGGAHWAGAATGCDGAPGGAGAGGTGGTGGSGGISVGIVRKAGPAPTWNGQEVVPDAPDLKDVELGVLGQGGTLGGGGNSVFGPNQGLPGLAGQTGTPGIARASLNAF